jgi:hypothetical protein
MPCTVTAFGVKIASLGDAAMELIIAREVITEWNACHALKQKRILLPLGAQDGGCSTVDLLVDFFCDSPGATCDIEKDVIEIEQQLKAGRPALIYFSEGRAELTGTHALDRRVLDEFRKKYAAATVDSYGDEKAFRAKFTQHLDATVSHHAHFKLTGTVPSGTAQAIPAAATMESLSSRARTILIEACDDFEAYIGRIKAGGMLKIQANGKQLVEQNDAATVAGWESAFQELLTGDLIHNVGGNGQLFQISTKGFAFLKTIGKTPVGYIAEMGGM